MDEEDTLLRIALCVSGNLLEVRVTAETLARLRRDMRGGDSAPVEYQTAPYDAYGKTITQTLLIRPRDIQALLIASSI